MKNYLVYVLIASLLILSDTAVVAEIAVSANDGKQLRDGDAISTPTPDSISVLDISNGRVKIVGSLAVPAAMIGPPGAVALNAGGDLAIVTACQTFQADKLVPADTVSVIDLSHPSRPRLLQTLHAGLGASGVSISPNGRLALVANSKEDSVSVFAIEGKVVTNVAKVQLEANSGPTDVVFTPDGATAIAVAQRASKLILLSVKGISVTPNGRALVSGRAPYGAVVTHDGRYIINTNLGGAMPPAETAIQPQSVSTAEGAPRPRGAGGMSRAGTISMTNIASGTLSASVVVGPVPEHVALSSDGKFVVAVIANGSAPVRSSPTFDSVLGILEVLAVGDGTLTPVARADSGHWCQGAAFSKDDKTILLQCAAEREVEVFHFDGSTLTQDRNAAISTVSRPGSIATATSR